MFNFTKLGFHLNPLLFGQIDPVSLELMREERRVKRESMDAEGLAEARRFSAEDERTYEEAA